MYLTIEEKKHLLKIIEENSFKNKRWMFEKDEEYYSYQNLNERIKNKIINNEEVKQDGKRNMAYKIQP